MKPFHDYDLRSVIANQWSAVCKRIDNMSNEEIMANDLEILADNIYQEFFIEPVMVFEEDFSKRSIKQGKIKKYVDPFFRDYSGKEYVDVDGVIASFYFPYQGDKDLFQCRASAYSLSGYPDITVDNKYISFHIERSLAEMDKVDAKDDFFKGLEYSLNRIKDGLSYVNRDVNSFNNSLKEQALKLIQEKKTKVEKYFNITKMFEVPIEKKEYAETHIPLKRNIVPVAKKYETSNYYGITDTDYKDILMTIKHTGSTCERTPGSYKSLQEEDLRNILLAALNATYKGDATGETFRNNGKTDICIERDNRAAFIAECKMWTGSKSVGKAITQLDGYLTWRDYKTALIYFVRKKEFIKILDTAEEALRSFDGMKNVTALDKNEFECSFLSRSNPGQLIKMRVFLFNFYCEE